MISVRLEGLFRWSETASQYGSDFIHQSRLEHFPGPAVQVFIESFAFRREPDFQCAKAFECASSLLEQFANEGAQVKTRASRQNRYAAPLDNFSHHQARSSTIFAGGKHFIRLQNVDQVVGNAAPVLG